jgi:uncharacterized membrane protein (UPF0127 family)
MLSIMTYISLLCESTSQAQNIRLQIGTKTLLTELVTTQTEMIIGLSNTKHLPSNAGMLFVFPFKDFHCMTMESTKIPLSLAFLDDSMNIIEFTNMYPLSNINYCASKPIKYAIEANYNWFNNVMLNTNATILK